jgi:hypothetical protein
MKSTLEIWLDFGKAVLWPAVALIGLCLFRSQLSKLLGRLAKLKIGDTEVEFQHPSTESILAPKEVKKALETIGPGGFLTEEGIRNVIKSSGLMDGDEKSVGQILIFFTTKQRTWLVVTTKSVFCVLDDDNTRTSGRLIQWVQLRESIDVVEAIEYKPTTGLLTIGKRKNWLYSTALYSRPVLLEDKIKKLLGSKD